MSNEKILWNILKPIGCLCKIDPNSEEISKGLLSRVCLEVDVSRPLKSKVKYIRNATLYECLIDYENITSICYGCCSQFQNLTLVPLILKVLLSEWKSYGNRLK